MMIWSQVIDQGSVSFYVVIGVVSNWVGFIYVVSGDFVSWDVFSNQVVNNGLSMFFRQLLVVSFGIDVVGVVQNNSGIVFWIYVVQLSVQLIQSLLIFWFQGSFVEVEQNVRFQGEVFGSYFWSWSWSWSNNWCSIFLIEVVGNVQVQYVVIRMGIYSVCVVDVVNLLVFQMGSDVMSNSLFYVVSKYWGNVSVVFVMGNVGRSVVVFGVSVLNYVVQMGVDVQIVSDWVIQFSGQLNVLSFESIVVNVVFICYMVQLVIIYFEIEVWVNLVIIKCISIKLIVMGWIVVVLEIVIVEIGVVILGLIQFIICISGVIFWSGLCYGSEVSQCYCNCDSCFFYFLCFIII